MKNMHTGFTLIELLVVVLIIGILASVALPQYQKAVWKSRFTEVLTTANALEKAVQLYNLDYDGSQNGEYLHPEDLDIDVLSQMTPLQNVVGAYCAKHACYTVPCEASVCRWQGWVFEKSPNLNIATIGWYLNSAGWHRYCYYSVEESETDLGKMFCESLRSQGWEVDGSGL